MSTEDGKLAKRVFAHIVRRMLRNSRLPSMADLDPGSFLNPKPSSCLECTWLDGQQDELHNGIVNVACGQWLWDDGYLRTNMNRAANCKSFERVEDE